MARKVFVPSSQWSGVTEEEAVVPDAMVLASVSEGERVDTIQRCASSDRGWSRGRASRGSTMIADSVQSTISFRTSALLEALEESLEAALPQVRDSTDTLAEAMRYAVLGGGKRLRPRLLVTVAVGCLGEPLSADMADLVLRAAVAVELMHSASLVHDDLPCFDDASLRRGRATVHEAYDEPMAVLVGDGLICAAFDVLASYEGSYISEALQLGRMLAAASGPTEGIVGGQSLELVGSETPRRRWSRALVERYHSMKTAALFRYATRAGALAVGCSREQQVKWGEVGASIGIAFQLADDLLDVHGTDEEAGKTTGRDLALDRPNHAICFGSEHTMVVLSEHLSRAHALIDELARKPKRVRELLGCFDALLDAIHGAEAS